MAGLSVRSDDEAKWSDLEQAFFDAAPPDEPSGLPVHLDDSPLSATPPPRDRLANLRRRSRSALATMRPTVQGLLRKVRAVPWFTPLTSPWLSRRSVAIGLASAIVLMGFSAGVIASRSGGGAGTPIAPAAALVAASADDPSASDATRVRAGSAPRPHPHAAKHPHARASAAKHAHHPHSKPATRHAAH